ncbi:GNAT family N-acetyltransferase [Chitinimonas sp. BJB300]|uniref:GNAT family N-acetyltransferase n=1 Tax=Chitinimonas sp. BJB300 TaxID=1559339 RepID=UPI000C10F1C1|nr:GNAT family N-acetyltransferase [Chitinimonas sp. BJB300]PHV11044.1 GNAT family N-acetyltransferase [Chitinimonas sp. BJB300]TSJ90072.1 GNAT family N-acetyltransferase [Chitinimonas sp. BJB300]
MPHIVPITNDARQIIEPLWLARAESVHRELRPQLEADYAAQMATIFADGAGMVVAVQGETVVGVAVFRHYRDTFSGTRFYIDDLVTTSLQRSQGVGKLLLDWLRQEAYRCGAKEFKLDSGTQRQQAHKFYFREGLVITSFNFTQSL